MSEETQSRAIEPFYTTKEFGTGSGLGLSMVYGFAVQSGGTMSIVSTPKEGTAVTLFLPRSAISPEVNRGDAPNKIVTGGGQTVLLIEDNPSVRGSVTRLLESLDYAVTATESVEAAKEIMKQVPDDPAIILSDIVLADGQPGTDFVREIRHTHPKIAVILMTGYAHTEESEMADTLQGVLLLNKPFARAELAAALTGAVQKS